jgi:transcriptional regulator with XRE-family HTH domain
LRYDNPKAGSGKAERHEADAVKLGEKLRYLREVEGNLRGLDRAMTQLELVRAIKAELGVERGASISQSYLSQIESGARPHLTNTTRQLLAKFFKVHPGYLVDDPEGYHAELVSDARTIEDKLDLWLVSGAERFRRDAELKQALLAVARHSDSRRCLLLLNAVIDTPGLVDRLFEVLHGGRGPERRETKAVALRANPLKPKAGLNGAPEKPGKEARQ